MKIFLMCLTLLVGACTVGPDYKRPTADLGSPTFKELKGWKPAQPNDEKISQNWWTVFNDPYLGTLVEQVNLNNQNLSQAEAQFRQAQALVQGANAAYFPTINASATTSRFRAATGQSVAVSGVRNLFGTAISLAWEPDLWGQVRRQVEANKATAQASFATLQGLRLSTQATLVQNYFQLRTLDMQKQVLRDSLDAYAKSLQITQNQYAAGIIAKADIIQIETQIAALQAQLIDLGILRSALEHSIAMLMGKPPSALSIKEGPFNYQLPTIPTGIPSDLLERRPDIATAERQIAAANAQIGVAKAAYFPTLNLSASNGYQTSNINNLFTAATRYWAMGPAAFALPLFDGGARGAQLSNTLATYDASVAAYRQTVLIGFQEVEDNLSSLRLLEQEAEQQDKAVRLAEQALRLTVNQYKAGTVSYLNVIAANNAALTNKKAAAVILGERFNATVLLIKALGGGWSNKDMPDSDHIGGKAKWSQFLPIPINSP